MGYNGNGNTVVLYFVSARVNLCIVCALANYSLILIFCPTITIEVAIVDCVSLCRMLLSNLKDL